MENASKALLIAGGILLAMLTAALIVLLSNNIKTIQNAQSKKTAQEQLVAFNRSYEAYNKKIMYGTDIISVVNKAIANNNLMQLRGDDQETNKSIGYVNIIIKANNAFVTEVYEVDNLKPNSTKDLVYTSIKSSNRYTETEINNILNQDIGKESFDIGNNSMGTWQKTSAVGGTELKMNNDFIDFFNDGGTSDYVENYIDTTKKIDCTLYVYSALTTFKKSVFTCSSVDYNENGRIKEMTFTQVQEK